MSENKIRLLIVDDEVRFLQTLSQRLTMRDFDVTPVSSGNEAVELARRQEFDLALVDLKMPGMTGEQVLRTFRREHPLMEVVILTGHGSVDSAVECLKEGSYNYLQKPCETDELMEVLKEAYKTRVQRKLRIDSEKMGEIMSMADGGSALAILRRLKEIDEKGG
jgi:DNA-binding NtrC family response regulator